MRLKLFILLFTWFMPAFAFGQGSITISSENGERFYLLLNGDKQNPIPQNNIRVDGLLSETYDAKILFEDETKAPISEKLINALSNSSQYQETTYKIVKSNDGSYKIKKMGTAPVATNFNAPPGMYYTHYGQPSQAVTPPPNHGNGGGSITIVPAGVNLQINAQDQNEHNASETTTSSSYSPDNSPTPVPEREKCQSPMDKSSFKTAKETVAKETFEDTKLSVAESILVSNCVSTDEVIEICKLFGFEDSKLKFAKAAYPRTTDPANYNKVTNVFGFAASKTNLKNFISNGGR